MMLVVGVIGEAEHEDLVDLELVDRQATQVRERRIARAVVVDRELAAERRKALEIANRVARIVENRAFGDLERDPLRRAVLAR